MLGRKLAAVGSGNAGLDFLALPTLKIEVIPNGLVHEIIDWPTGLLRQLIQGLPRIARQIDGYCIGHRTLRL